MSKDGNAEELLIYRKKSICPHILYAGKPM